jgi:hypothetical protein
MPPVQIVVAFIVVTCFGIASQSACAADPPHGPQIVEESMHEFMEYVFEPSFKRLKAGMAVESKDAAAWKGIKGEALALAESSNLLFARAPKEGAADWAGHASAARAEAARLYQTAKAKDAAAAKEAYGTMLTKCNACHKQFAKGKHQLAP